MKEKEVVARLAWDCKPCEQSGVIDLDCYPDVMGCMRRARQAHRAASPACKAECPNFYEVPLEHGH